MAINKKLIHFDLFSDFSSKKLSANKENTKYTLGIEGAIKNGSPDILWHSICWIKDKSKMWTHGRLYNCSDANIQAVDLGEEVDDVEIGAYVKYVPQTLTEAEKAQARANIGVTSNGGSGVDTSEFVTRAELSDVATSGSYNDLSDKPTIPSAVTESTVSGWGFTKNTGTYSKPSGGIPKSDLASAVQTSLGKADTALQSYTEQYKGTVTGVTMNGNTRMPVGGVIDLGKVITEHQSLSGKQDKLVSGTNVKTINGSSLLGSGDLHIGKQYVATNGTITSMLPDTVYYVNSYNPSITISGFELSDNAVNEYFLHFHTGNALPSISLPSYLKWANGEYPTFETDTDYELSVTATSTYTDDSGTPVVVYKAIVVPFVSI